MSPIFFSKRVLTIPNGYFNMKSRLLVINPSNQGGFAMKDRKQQWFYTIWIIAHTLLFIGLNILSVIVDRISDNFWIVVLADILKSLGLLTGFILLSHIFRKTREKKGDNKSSIDD